MGLRDTPPFRADHVGSLLRPPELLKAREDHAAGRIDDAVRIANDSPYGLAAAVFTTDEEAGLDVARRIESGICHVNGATVHDEPPMPFGGVKASGWGRFGGTAALHEFTDLRWITVQHGERHYPI